MGQGDDNGRSISVDSTGNAYITGETSSTQASFPVTIGSDITHNGGEWDAYVAKVSESGGSIDYAGYIGGANDDYVLGIAVYVDEDLYLVGLTGSSQWSFPVTGGPDLTFNGGIWDAFVAKVRVVPWMCYLPLMVSTP